MIGRGTLARTRRSAEGDTEMTTAGPSVTYKSPLQQMTQTTPTCLWNDSASIDELTYAIENGAVGATCNPVIAVSVLRSDTATWLPRAESRFPPLGLRPKSITPVHAITWGGGKRDAIIAAKAHFWLLQA